MPQISAADVDNAFNYANFRIASYPKRYANSSGYSIHTPPLVLKEKEALSMEYVSEYFAKL